LSQIGFGVHPPLNPTTGDVESHHLLPTVGTWVSNCHGFDILAIRWAKANGSSRDWVVMLELLCLLKTCWISPDLVEISPKSQ